MRQTICPLCEVAVDDDVWEYHRAQEDRVIELIKQYNPAWVLADGSCPKAIYFYRATVLNEATDYLVDIAEQGRFYE